MLNEQIIFEEIVIFVLLNNIYFAIKLLFLFIRWEINFTIIISIIITIKSLIIVIIKQQ